MSGLMVNAKVAAAVTELSSAARLADMVSLSMRVVEQEPDPFADRSVVTAPELEVSLRRRCCTVTIRIPMGSGLSGQSFACIHQAPKATAKKGGW